MNNTAQLRLVLDVRYDLNGTSVETLKKNLQRLVDEAYADGRLSSGTDAEVDEHSFTVMETPEPLEEGEVSDFLLERIESGQLRLEDIPATMARYGLMETPDFVAEIRERLDHQAADSAPDSLVAQPFQRFMVAQKELIDELFVEHGFAAMNGRNLAEFFSDAASDLKDALGSDAANACSDDEEEQDTAISAAEQWVTDNVSHSTEACIAAVLYLQGIPAGITELRRRFK